MPEIQDLLKFLFIASFFSRFFLFFRLFSSFTSRTTSIWPFIFHWFVVVARFSFFTAATPAVDYGVCYINFTPFLCFSFSYFVFFFIKSNRCGAGPCINFLFLFSLKWTEKNELIIKLMDILIDTRIKFLI